MDFNIVGLPHSQLNTTQYLLCVVDRLTKLAHSISATKKDSATKVPDLLIRHIFRIHELPKTIMSNRLTCFTVQF